MTAIEIDDAEDRAIIIDDDIFILNLLKDFFLMGGYEVLCFGDPTIVCLLSTGMKEKML